MEDYILFSSSLKDFKNDKKIILNSKTSDLDVLKYYLSIQIPINKHISFLLEKIIDVKKLEKESKDLFALNETDFLKELNSKVMKKKINEILTDYEKDQKKALYSSCKVYILEKYFSKKEVFPSMHKMWIIMDESINFISSTKEYKAVKKMKVIPGVKEMDVLEFLVSVEVTTNLQINRLLEKMVDVNGLNLEVSNLFTKDVTSFIKEISSSFVKNIEKYIKAPYKQDKELLDVLKSYSLNKYLLHNKIMEEDAVGYYKILFPARKKQLKKAILK